jgi:NTE family protein
MLRRDWSSDVCSSDLPDIGVTEFERHAEIYDASYLWAREAIEALEAEGNAAIAAILATANTATTR